MAKGMRLKPSYPERYESTTDSEVESDPEPDFEFPEDEEQEEEIKEQFRPLIRNGRQELTCENFNRVIEKSRK